jgi:hypothetical protein
MYSRSHSREMAKWFDSRDWKSMLVVAGDLGSELSTNPPTACGGDSIVGKCSANSSRFKRGC